MTREEASNILDDYDVNFDGHTAEEIAEAFEVAFRALEQESCEDAISRKSIKHKLQEHHDFFVNAYGGFSNLPQNDKSRVDEITNCIAMVVNEPPVNPQSKMGHWIISPNDCFATCSECGLSGDKGIFKHYRWCPICGTKMSEIPTGSELQEREE